MRTNVQNYIRPVNENQTKMNLIIDVAKPTHQIINIKI